jgi:hypothetical protein
MVSTALDLRASKFATLILHVHVPTASHHEYWLTDSIVRYAVLVTFNRSNESLAATSLYPYMSP